MRTNMYYTRMVSIALFAIMEWICLSQTASASIMVQLDSVAPDIAFPGNYRWKFSASITPTDGFISGGDNYFTIYDVPGTLVTVESPLYWNASSHNTGDTPPGLSPTDDPSIVNVIFKYGSLSSRPGSDAVSAGSTFDIILSEGTPSILDYSWQDYSAYPVSNGQLQNGLGRTALKNGGTAPEPATLALVGLGLAGLGLSRRKRVS